MSGAGRAWPPAGRPPGTGGAAPPPDLIEILLLFRIGIN